MTGTFETTDGVKIKYYDQGQGSPILCLAGLTRNSSDFDCLLPHLAGHRVLRMDYRGRGQSDWANPETYMIPREAQDSLELLNHLNVEKFAIIGTSRGGLIAMTLAVMARERLSGVLLNDIGPELMDEGLADIQAYIGRNPKESTIEEAAEMRAKLLPGFTDVTIERWRQEVRNNYDIGPNGLIIKYDPKLRESVIAAATVAMPDLWPLFDQLQGLPLAGLRGANSNLLSQDCFDEMRRRRPDMISAVVPDRGHPPFLDEPASIEVLRRFFGAIE